MSLTLATPTGPVTRFAGGVVMIRCADYIDDDSRATIEAISDPDSVCGTVVHETQSLPYIVIDDGSMVLPDDPEYVDYTQGDLSLRIPYADLGLEDAITYVVYIGVKVTGDGSVGHRLGNTFMTLSANSQDVDIAAFDDSLPVTPPDAFLHIGMKLPRPQTNDGYRIQWYGYIDWDTDDNFHFVGEALSSAPTDIVFIGCSGEDSTYELYLDCIYLVPYQSDTNSDYFLQPADLTAWDPLFDNNNTFDPRPDTSFDDDSSSNGLATPTQDAQFSVMYAEPPGFGTQFFAPGGDYQKAKNEGSFFSICNFFWDGIGTLDDPVAATAITLSPIYIPAQTIETETFPTDMVFDGSFSVFESASDQFYWTLKQQAFGDIDITSGSLRMLNTIIDASIRRQSFICLGKDGFLDVSPSYATTKPLLEEMNAGIIETTTSITATPTPSELMRSFVGFYQKDWPRYQSSGEAISLCGAFLYVEGGDLKATLRMTVRSTAGLHGATDFGTSPVTIQGGYTGDVIRVKVEHRYYVWRAKVWIDGGSEPGSWTLEGFMPSFVSDTLFSPSSWVITDYPYAIVDRDDWGENCRSTADWYATVGVSVEPDAGATGAGSAIFGPVTYSYDPNGTRGDMSLSMEKYDGTVQYGTVTMSTDRIAIASIDNYTFEHDGQGFNLYLWNEAGSADLQSACASDVFMRAFDPLPLFGSIKRP